MKPSLIIPRLRQQVAALGERVAGVAAYAAAAQQTEFPRPHAFVVPLGEEAGENQTVGGVTQVVRARFGVIVAVSNLSDERGQAGAEQLEDIRDALIAALVGWTPLAQRFDVIAYDGTPEDPQLDRAVLWQRYDFNSIEIISGPAL